MVVFGQVLRLLATHWAGKSIFSGMGAGKCVMRQASALELRKACECPTENLPSSSFPYVGSSREDRKRERNAVSELEQPS